jgi:Leucine-rich repeat (LRR) protein
MKLAQKYNKNTFNQIVDIGFRNSVMAANHDGLTVTGVFRPSPCYFTDESDLDFSVFKELHICSASSVNDLNLFPNTEHLTMYDCKLDDLDGLKHLKHLTALSIVSTDIGDATAFIKYGFPHLKELAICISDGNYNLSVLSKLNGLEQLEIIPYEQKFSDISFLEGLQNLCSLVLQDCGITDISPVQHCKKLKKLDLSMNYKLNDISVIGTLAELEELSIISADITDISSISGLKSLKKVNFADNPISKR